MCVRLARQLKEGTYPSQAGCSEETLEAIILYELSTIGDNIRYPCTWQLCTHQANTKTRLKYYIPRAHTKECQVCEDQLDIWWGCIHPGEMTRHKAKKHPL